MEFIKKHARFVIAGVALLIAFGLSISFNNRGWQFDLERGGSSAFASPEQARPGGYNLAGAEILDKVILQMQEKYVDPTRVNPSKMLAFGLDELQKSVPEVVVKFDKMIDEEPTRAEVQVGTQTKTFRIQGMDSLWEMSFKMKDIFRFLQDNLKEDEDLKFNEVEYAAINGMLNTLDPHSVLLNPEVYKEMQTQTGGKFGGLGITIGIRDDQLTVIAPMDGTPAARAGIKSNDRITRINDESTVNMTISDAVNRLRGEPGTPVTIWVKRKEWTEAKPIPITRAIIRIESTEAKLLSNKIGYVKIKNFQANTTNGLHKHLKTMSQQAGGLNGLVLDLRNNPGGLLDQAIKVSDTFLSEGTIVSTVGYGNTLRDENKASKRDTQPRYPIVVLVDPGSASASEIVAGALKNHNRAIIVGDTTFGKGSVQVIYELDDGSALKLTIAQYLTPGDVSIQSVGIIPDIQLRPVSTDQDNLDLFASNQITREADLDAHLDHKNVAKGNKPAATIGYFKEPTKDDDKDNENPDDTFREDFAIRFAKKALLASGQTTERTKMLSTLAPTLRSVSDSETKRITAALKPLGIDWSQGPSDPAPKLDISITTDQPKNTIQAGNTITLTATVTNNGTQPLHRLRAVSTSDNNLFDDREFIFGKLNPKQSITRTQTIKIPDYHPSRYDVLTLKVGAMNTDISTTAQATLHVQEHSLPRFSFNYSIDDSKQGNGDGILQPNEQATLNLFIQNVGQGPSGKTTAYLRNLNDASLFLKQGRVQTDSIQPGTPFIAPFSFEVKSLPKDGTLKVDVEIFDETYKEFTSKKLTLPTSPKTSTKTKRATGSFQTSKNSPVHLSAQPSSPTIATLPSGQTARAIAQTDSMVKVQLQPNITGWIPKTNGSLSRAKAPETTSFQAVYQSTSPDVSIPQPTAITDKETYTLIGTATDDKRIKDYYIFSFTTKNNRTQSQKIAYQSGGKSSIDINASVPLKDGMNRIRLYVRDSEDLTTSKTIYVYKK